MPDLRTDLRECVRLLCNGSRTFYFASWLLPARVRDAAVALYAFCRVADDDIDGGGGNAGLAMLEARLAAVYAGTPADHAVDRAFAWVVRTYDLPRALPEALLEGFRWDAAGRRYDTLDDVEDYAARVAGSVGTMMAVLMGARSAELLARAADLGVAMQLSNIARDVGEDARNARLYLPRQWLEDAGVDVDQWMRAPHHGPELGAVVLRLLARAEVLYARADRGIAGLPWGCRVGIMAARRCYAAIGQQVARRGGNGVDGRAVVSGWRKLAMLLVSMRALWPRRVEASAPPLAANRFLVEAAAWETRASNNRRSYVDGLQAVIEIFERLEKRDRERQPQTARIGG